MQDKNPDSQGDSTSLSLAFDLSNQSYGLMAQRMDAVNRRLEGLVSLAVTLTIAVPIFATALLDNPRRADFDSVVLAGALAAFVISLIIGLTARGWSGLKLLSPQAMQQDDWAQLSKPDFMKEIIYWAAEHWEHNSTVIYRKSWAAILMTIFFVIELLFFIGWIAELTE
ncbi:MAG: hypothetical protein V3R95_05530 [Dehalococcoidia bacterium]